MSTGPDGFTDALLDSCLLCAQASGLSESRIAELAGYAREHSVPLVRTIVERGSVDEGVFLGSIARLLGLEFLDAQPLQIPAEILAKVPASLVLSHEVIPIAEQDGTLAIACHDPFDWRRWDELSHLLGQPICRVLAKRDSILQLIRNHYGIGAATVERLLDSKGDDSPMSGAGGATDLSDVEAANEPTVVSLVNNIFSEAIAADVTDIHFEPFDSKYRVRYRIDGLLEDVSVPANVRFLKSAIVSRIKIMSQLDITEKRLPQDGRARVTLGGIEYDLRISILPGIYGEAINIRLQRRNLVKLDLSGLGFRADEQCKIEHLIGRPHGLILVTGPTGSGKTTTLYTCLNKINKPSTKIITIEDPVEYWMDDILQMQVHEEIGFDFARALRSMLRHDPDMLLIGEIRDRETADIAIRSALTGHMVFSTLHTNDAAGAISRLLDIGIEPFLASSSVSGIIAQRLIRQICSECKHAVTVEGIPGVSEAWEAEGCEACRYTGYRGRTVVSEVLGVSPGIRELIQDRQPADRIKQLARQEGMMTLRDSTMQAVSEGRTTLAEAIRVSQQDEL